MQYCRAIIDLNTKTIAHLMTSDAPLDVNDIALVQTNGQTPAANQYEVMEWEIEGDATLIRAKDLLHDLEIDETKAIRRKAGSLKVKGHIRNIQNKGQAVVQGAIPVERL